MSSHLNLEKEREETAGNEPSSDQKKLLVTGTKMVCMGRVLSGSA
jgi:hypothetical protein